MKARSMTSPEMIVAFLSVAAFVAHWASTCRWDAPPVLSSEYDGVFAARCNGM